MTVSCAKHRRQTRRDALQQPLSADSLFLGSIIRNRLGGPVNLSKLHTIKFISDSQMFHYLRVLGKLNRRMFSFHKFVD